MLLYKQESNFYYKKFKKGLIKLKTKIILIVTLMMIGITSGTIALINYQNKIQKEEKIKKQINNQKRYDEIKKDIDKEMQDYIYLIAPICEKGGPTFLITHEELVYNRGMSKEQFLDVDGKSYCKVYVDTECIEDNEWDWDVYISCKDYTDEEYQNWSKGFEPKQ